MARFYRWLWGVPFLSSSTLTLEDRHQQGGNMDARSQAWLDQEDARITEAIRKHGWWITYVGGGTCGCPDCDDGGVDEVPFAYTTGLFGLGHAELAVVGLDMRTTSELLNSLGQRIKGGQSLIPGIEITFTEWPGHKVIPEVIPNPGEIVFEANRFYQRPAEFSVPVLQLTYSDEEGRFPWDDGYAHPELQPRPGAWRA